MRYLLYVATVFAVLIMALGCSGGGDVTLPQPPSGNEAQAASISGKTQCMGLWQVTVDLQNETIDSALTRQADLMLNVLGFMEPPALSKLSIDFQTLVIDPVGKTIEVDVILMHPLKTPESAFNGFDVRGIVFGPDLLNADGYTSVMNPADFESVPFGYKDGLLGAPNSFANYEAPYWPYKYFCDGLDPNKALWEHFFVPENMATRGMFGEGQTNIRHYSLSWAGLEPPINFLVFNYAVYANFDWAVGETPYGVDDYPITTANSAEAFCFSYAVFDNTLWYYDGQGEGEFSIELRVWDWQGLDSTEYTITPFEPGVFDEIDGGFAPGSDPFDPPPAVTNIPATPTSTVDIEALVTITDNSATFGDAWFLGMLPETHSFYNQHVYSIWEISIPVSPEPGCPTIEPVDIEASPYNGTWFDDLTEDTACACEVENDGGTTLYWTHDPAATTWNSGSSGGFYDNDMDTSVIGPRILVPSTGALQFMWHFNSDVDADYEDGVTIGYKLNDDEPALLITQPGDAADITLDLALGGLTEGDEISWVINFNSNNSGNEGTGCAFLDATTQVYDPGPLPYIEDGGPPDPSNEICATGTPLSFTAMYASGYWFVYYMFVSSTMPVSWNWAGSPAAYLSVGDGGWLLPSYSVTKYQHRPCLPGGSDRFFPFGDYQATCQYLHYHSEFGTDCAGEVRHQALDLGTPNERWVIQWCDVGQIGEGGPTCNWRVIINGSNNTNPSDIRIEWLDVGTHADEDEDEHTAAWMIWNGVYIPIECDYTAWQNNTSVNIDQP